MKITVRNKSDDTIITYETSPIENACYQTSRPSQYPTGPKTALERRRAKFSKISRALFVKLVLRDGPQCLICGSTQDLTVDHIVPMAQGGSDDPDNLQLLCKSCNSRKGPR